MHRILLCTDNFHKR
uniref:Uncharacterized protein n=1 Tax=Arundo donax TaxID=35708 RepID=A0A0A9B6J3_ARUDO